MKTITYLGQKFPIREIEIGNNESVCVSIEQLNELMIDDSGVFVSAEAEYIDEQIFYYVEDFMIFADDNTLRNFLIDSVQ